VLRTAAQGQGQPTVEVTQSARLHPYAAWLERAERHLFAVAAEMARIGLEQRQARVSEELVAQFRRVTEGMLARLELSPEQRELIPDAVAASVRALTAVPSA
jgi:cob(I)alamin adenosyltransferase